MLGQGQVTTKVIKWIQWFTTKYCNTACISHRSQRNITEKTFELQFTQYTITQYRNTNTTIFSVQQAEEQSQPLRQPDTRGYNAVPHQTNLRFSAGHTERAMLYHELEDGMYSVTSYFFAKVSILHLQQGSVSLHAGVTLVCSSVM